MPLSKSFYDYNIKWTRHSLRVNAARALFCHDVLTQVVPLVNDEKSRAMAEWCTYWITFEEDRRGFLMDQLRRDCENRRKRFPDQSQERVP